MALQFSSSKPQLLKDQEAEVQKNHLSPEFAEEPRAMIQGLKEPCIIIQCPERWSHEPYCPDWVTNLQPKVYLPPVPQGPGTVACSVMCFFT